MRKLIYTLAAAAVLGLALPVATTPASAQDKVVIKKSDRPMMKRHVTKKVIIRTGERRRHFVRGGRTKVVIRTGERRPGWHRAHAKKIVIIKKRRGHRDHD